MDRIVMNKYIEDFMRKNAYSPDAEAMENLLTGGAAYAFTSQHAYEDPDCLQENIRNSVQSYTRDKDAAIRIYRRFLDYLQKNGISAEIHFPPVPISNSFERMMFIAKYLHDPTRKVAELPDLLWTSQRTIEADLKKLRGIDDDPIQICGKAFTIPETERSMGRIKSASTAHPLFLTLNLTQVLVTLKGLRAMSEDPLYEYYAMATAADIWEQLSDYAKNRIHFVLSELLPEDLTWYEKLEKPDSNLFYTERACSVRDNVLLECIKNDVSFCAEVRDGTGTRIYSNCHLVPRSYTSESVRITSDQGEMTLFFKDVLRSAYTPEELL